MRYLIPLKEPNEDGLQQVAWIDTSGKPKRRNKQVRKWLQYVAGIWQYEEQTAVIKALGFTDLL